jgi:hypothetical protein
MGNCAAVPVVNVLSYYSHCGGCGWLCNSRPTVHFHTPTLPFPREHALMEPGCLLTALSVTHESGHLVCALQLRHPLTHFTFQLPLPCGCVPCTINNPGCLGGIASGVHHTTIILSC